MPAGTRKGFTGNARRTTLASGINASAVAFSVAAGEGSGYPTGAGGPFTVKIDRGTAFEESVLVQSRVSDVFTVQQRGYASTPATVHGAGATVEHHVDYHVFDEANLIASVQTTKGDTIGFTTQPVRKAVGTDGTLWIADSTQADGIAWKSLAVARLFRGNNQSIASGGAPTNSIWDVESEDSYNLITAGVSLAMAGVWAGTYTLDCSNYPTMGAVAADALSWSIVDPLTLLTITKFWYPRNSAVGGGTHSFSFVGRSATVMSFGVVQNSGAPVNFQATLNATRLAF